jgi:hypothetical protein
VCKAVCAIVKHQTKIHYTHIDKEFEKSTGYKISDFFDFKENEMETFLKMKKHMFHIDEKGYARSKDYNE